MDETYRDSRSLAFMIHKNISGLSSLLQFACPSAAWKQEKRRIVHFNLSLILLQTQQGRGARQMTQK